MSKLRGALSFLLALVLFACGGPQPAAEAPVAAGCRAGAPVAGVYHPERLQVLDRCRHAEGTVVAVIREEDGDVHIWFLPDPGYTGLLNSENHFQGRPAMLAEITPRCPGPSSPADARAAARCPASNLPVPAIGDHISVDGPWVLDAGHGWQEIHPVQALTRRARPG